MNTRVTTASVVLLATVLVFQSSPAPAHPVIPRQTSSSGDDTDTDTDTALGYVFTGMISLGASLGHFVGDNRDQTYTLAENVTCMVYDTFNLLNAMKALRQSRDDGPTSTLTANMMIAETVLDQSCQWMKEDSSNFNCTFDEISILCLGRKLVDVYDNVRATGPVAGSSPSVTEWLRPIMDSFQ